MFVAVDPVSGTIFAGDQSAPFGVCAFSWRPHNAGSAAGGDRGSESAAAEDDAYAADTDGFDDDLAAAASDEDDAGGDAGGDDAERSQTRHVASGASR
jgi:hypothetical protein